MVEEIIKEQARFRELQRKEDDYILKLKTEAEGVSSIQYGDDTSHGTNTGDRLELAAIKLAEARAEIAEKRVPRFEVISETCDWFYDRLSPEPARIMVLYVIEGLSNREIAEKIGRSVGWVHDQIKKSKKILK